jgi:hypothetical protein
MMRCAASAIVCKPLEQKRFTVAPATLTGKPAASAACRAMFQPDRARVDACALDGGLDHMAAERRAMGHVEGALPALGQRRAGGGDDEGLGHGQVPFGEVPTVRAEVSKPSARPFDTSGRTVAAVT